jgi:hypothetical protein
VCQRCYSNSVKNGEVIPGSKDKMRGQICKDCVGAALIQEESKQKTEAFISRMISGPLKRVLGIQYSVEVEGEFEVCTQTKAKCDVLVLVKRHTEPVYAFILEIDAEQHKGNAATNEEKDQDKTRLSLKALARLAGADVPRAVIRVSPCGAVDGEPCQSALDTWFTVRDWMVAALRSLSVPALRRMLPAEWVLYVNFDSTNGRIYKGVPWANTTKAPALKSVPTVQAPDWVCSLTPAFVAEWQGMEFLKQRVLISAALHTRKVGAEFV